MGHRQRLLTSLLEHSRRRKARLNPLHVKSVGLQSTGRIHADINARKTNIACSMLVSVYTVYGSHTNFACSMPVCGRLYDCVYVHTREHIQCLWHGVRVCAQPFNRAHKQRVWRVCSRATNAPRREGEEVKKTVTHFVIYERILDKSVKLGSIFSLKFFN